MWPAKHSCSARAKRTLLFGEKCSHFSALYYVNALHVFVGFSFHCVLKLNLE